MQQVGPYRIVRELGRGGMGVVFEAEDARSGRRVAVKLLLAPLAERARRRFEREAEVCSRLDHPHVVGVEETGYDAGRPYLVMPLLAGQTLAEVLARGPLPLAEALRIAAELARGLDYVHGQGLVHRDVKPSNVILVAGRAVLADFGLVLDDPHAQDRLTRTGTLLGTPLYMSPEQASGHAGRADARSDIYSLGVVLHEMLTGELPFGDDPLGAMARAAQEAPPPASASRPEVDAALDAICARCLARSPAARYPDAGTLAEALERWPGARGSARGRVRAAAPALIMIGIAAAGWWVWTGAGLPEPAFEPLRALDNPTASALPTAAEVQGALQAARRMVLLPAASLRDVCHTLEAASARAPADAVLLTNLGLCLHELGESGWRAAVQRALATPRLPDDRAAAWLCRASLELDAAARVVLYARAAEVEPSDSRIYHPWVRSLIEADQLDDAARVAQAALAQAPGEAHRRLAWAMVLKHQGQRDRDVQLLLESLALLDDVLAEEPTCAWACSDRGYSRFEFGRATQDDAWTQPALRDLRQAIDLRPDHSFYTWTLGVVAQGVGDYETAVWAYGRTLEADAKNPMPWLNRALSQLQLGDRAAAVRGLEAALGAIDRSSPNAAAVERLLDRLRRGG